MRAWLGLAVLAALALDAWTKGAGNISEMLWACHWASALIAMGLLADSRTAAAAGLLFHLALGIPAWLLGILFTGEVYPTSVLVHSAPAVAALVYLRGIRTWPRHAWSWAWIIHPAAIAVSERFARPELNVNMAHQPWPPLAHLFASLHLFHLSAISLSLIMLLLMNRAMERWVAERAQPRRVRASREPHTFPAQSGPRPQGCGKIEEPNSVARAR
ncbi:MAG TPA: hypothetical protein VNK82_12075 [Terriglobales bacterium]|nr:hypothetical protein [Terriglobales bacterium]